MNTELTTAIIKNEEFNMEDLENKFSTNRLFKKIDKKYKICLAIIIAIIIGLLCILIFWIFHSSKVPKEQTDQTEKAEKTKLTEENKGKEKIKKTILLNLEKMPEIKKYYENFPYTIIINENGVVDINYSSLNHISVEKIIGVEENCYEFTNIEINEESKTSSSEDLSLSCDIDYIIHSDIKYKNKIEEITNESKKVSYIMVKKKLASFSINREDIHLTDFYKTKIEELANQESDSVEEKAKDLDELFADIGYFIPTKIIIGGYFYVQISQIENEALINIINEFKGNINYTDIIDSSVEYNTLNEEIFKYLFLEKKIKIVGGNSSNKSFDEWEKSLNYENARIIEHSLKKPIYKLINDFLDKDIKDKLKEPLKLVSQKYDKRKDYFDNLNEAKKSIIVNEIQGDYEKNNGLCKKDDLIYSIKIEIREEGTRKISKSFSDIIVGWNIISNWGDDTNGIYTFKDPILSKKMYFEFTSKKWCFIFFCVQRKQDSDLEIFLMKLPEENN